MQLPAESPVLGIVVTLPPKAQPIHEVQESSRPLILHSQADGYDISIFEEKRLSTVVAGARLWKSRHDQRCEEGLNKDKKAAIVFWYLIDTATRARNSRVGRDHQRNFKPSCIWREEVAVASMRPAPGIKYPFWSNSAR